MTVASTAEPVPYTAEFTCSRCGSVDDGRFCSNCGARLRRVRDLSLKHYLREALAAVTDIDSALIGTFRTLLTQPGRLSYEYLHGDRHRFLPPVRVFLLCNVVYFLFATQYGSTVLTAPLGQVGVMPYRVAALPVLERRYQLTPRGPQESFGAAFKRVPEPLAKRFDAATEELGKTILVVLIPTYALLFAFMFAGTERYFVEHLVFATHFVSVALLALPGLFLALIGYSRIVTLVAGHGLGVERVGFPIIGVALVAYLFRAQRVFYASRPAPAAIRSLVILATFMPVVIAFKFVLFLATLAWIGR